MDFKELGNFSLLYEKDLLGKVEHQFLKKNTCLHFVKIIMGHLMLMQSKLITDFQSS